MTDQAYNSVGMNSKTGLLAPVELVKLEDFTATNTVAFADDAELVYSIAAGEVIYWDCLIQTGGNMPGAAVVRFATPAAPAAGSILGVWTDNTGAQQQSVIGLAAYNGGYGLYTGGAVTDQYVAMFKGRLVNGVNAGQFRCQFAQFAANVTPTLILPGSYLNIWKLVP